LPVPVINEGPHTIRLSGGVSGEFHPAAVLTLKALERPEKLAAGQ
jgi:hypothetical protein